MTFQQIVIDKPVRISIQEAAKRMGVAEQFLRVALQHEKFDFGIAVKDKRWTYYINAERFEIYMKGRQA